MFKRLPRVALYGSIAMNFELFLKYSFEGINYEDNQWYKLIA